MTPQAQRMAALLRETPRREAAVDIEAIVSAFLQGQVERAGHVDALATLLRVRQFIDEVAAELIGPPTMATVQ